MAAHHLQNPQNSARTTASALFSLRVALCFRALPPKRFHLLPRVGAAGNDLIRKTGEGEAENCARQDGHTAVGSAAVKAIGGAAKWKTTARRGLSKLRHCLNRPAPCEREERPDLPAARQMQRRSSAQLAKRGGNGGKAADAGEMMMTLDGGLSTLRPATSPKFDNNSRRKKVEILFHQKQK